MSLQNMVAGALESLFPRGSGAGFGFLRGEIVMTWWPIVVRYGGGRGHGGTGVECWPSLQINATALSLMEINVGALESLSSRGSGSGFGILNRLVVMKCGPIVGRRLPRRRAGAWVVV